MCRQFLVLEILVTITITSPLVSNEIRDSSKMGVAPLPQHRRPSTRKGACIGVGASGNDDSCLSSTKEMSQEMNERSVKP